MSPLFRHAIESVIVIASTGALPAVAAPTTETVAGRYVLEDVMEMASEIRLDRNGRFGLQRSYGALDETAEGKWRIEGGRVLLTSEPAVVPPRFERISATHDPAGTLIVTVADGTGKPVPDVDVLVEFDDGEVEIGATGAEGFALTPPAGRRITALRLGFAVMDFASDPFPVDMAVGNRMAFRFDANDVGKLDLRDMPFAIGDDTLAIERDGTRMTYRRAAD